MKILEQELPCIEKQIEVSEHPKRHRSLPKANSVLMCFLGHVER